MLSISSYSLIAMQQGRRNVKCLRQESSKVSGNSTRALEIAEELDGNAALKSSPLRSRKNKKIQKTRKK